MSNSPTTDTMSGSNHYRTSGTAAPQDTSSFEHHHNNRNRATSNASNRIRSATQSFLESAPPSGMWYASAEAAADVPSLSQIRQGSVSSSDGRPMMRQRTSSGASVRRKSGASSTTRSPTSPTVHRSTLTSTAENGNDPFTSFIGRGEMSNQSYIPKGAKHAPTTTSDPLDDESEGLPLSTLKERPTRETTESTAAPDSPPNTSASKSHPAIAIHDDGVFPNGYSLPPKHTRSEATVLGLKAFWKFTLTPLGFLIVIYGLNVVAWGGMLFLLLIGGGNAMCYPHDKPPGYRNCNDINSPRRIWIEIDSQILNALFCVTGFGLIPWRFRDFYYLLQYRIGKNYIALRKLAGIHRGWFRLPGSESLPLDHNPTPEDPSVPLPVSKAIETPLTGIRAPPTAIWRLDYVIWAYVINTFLQAVLSGFMWGMNRYNRPSWATGLFIALACIIAAMGGIMVYNEGKRVKNVEGVPWTEEETAKHGMDVEKVRRPLVNNGVEASP